MTNARKGEAGRRGPDVRSDCWVSVALADTGGMELKIESKVAAMYGRAIEAQVREGLAALGVSHGRVELYDTGALPFAIAARLEAAVKRADPSRAGTYLPLRGDAPAPLPVRDRFRRSRLYLPGNEPKFMLNAGLHRPDGIILDLEDSVAPPEKDAARLLVRNALRAIDFHGAERMVRVNQFPLGIEDLRAVGAERVDVILIPKCESADQVRAIAQELDRVKAAARPEDRAAVDAVLFMPILESALGVLRALEIALASRRVVALTIGLEDYTADLGCPRTREGRESFWARGQVVNAARAAGVQAIDTVFSDIGDPEGLRASVREAKSLGFEGKGCLHPRQIGPVHEEFRPTAEEEKKARIIVAAFEAAQARGEAVVALGSKMIDPPVVKRALRVIKLLETCGAGPRPRPGQASGQGPGPGQKQPQG